MTNYSCILYDLLHYTLREALEYLSILAMNVELEKAATIPPVEHALLMVLEVMSFLDFAHIPGCLEGGVVIKPLQQNIGSLLGLLNQILADWQVPILGSNVQA